MSALPQIRGPANSKSHPRLKAFILETLSEKIQIALAEAKSVKQKTASAASTESVRAPLPFWEISDSISPEIAK